MCSESNAYFKIGECVGILRYDQISRPTVILSVNEDKESYLVRSFGTTEYRRATFSEIDLHYVEIDCSTQKRKTR